MKTGEVGSSTLRATLCPISLIDTSDASSIRSVMGRLPITRVKRYDTEDPSIYQSGPYHQHLNAILAAGNEEQRPLNPKAKSRVGARAARPKVNPEYLVTRARAKRIDDEFSGSEEEPLEASKQPLKPKRGPDGKFKK